MAGRIEFAPLPDWVGIRLGEIGDQGDGYLWGEAQCLNLYNWYMNERASRAQASKVLRLASVLFAVAGATIPLAALADDQFVNSDWGFVGLTLGAGCLLVDRAFGYSKSWMRYASTALSLQALILKKRAQLLVIISGTSSMDGAEKEHRTMAITVELMEEALSLVSRETREWVSDFESALQELEHRASTQPR